ncbi:MAG: 50S ribosomal protein L9, partial [Acidimicrobiia bacterium]|nr:50S ribosomal protein L9 [Acidimicrobiia bacterium]
VSVTEIVDAVSSQLGVELDRHLVHIDEPIRVVGAHQVKVRLHPEVEVPLGVEVSAA